MRLSGPAPAKSGSRAVQLAPVVSASVGTMDPRPYMKDGADIRRAQLEYLQSKVVGAKEEFAKLPKRKHGGSFERAGSFKGKNRYADVLPYDDNLITLHESPDGSDYINASFVTFPTLDKSVLPYYFVCSQGPTAQTVNDHWCGWGQEEGDVAHPIVFLCAGP